MNCMDSCSVGVDDRDRSSNFDGLQKVRESIGDGEKARIEAERRVGPAGAVGSCFGVAFLLLRS